MYDLLYTYLYSYVFNSSTLNSFADSLGINVSLNAWLCHSTCIVLMALFIILLITFAYWLFKLVSGFILLK